jgi:hypothetical protein
MPPVPGLGLDGRPSQGGQGGRVVDVDVIDAARHRRMVISDRSISVSGVDSRHDDQRQWSVVVTIVTT